MFHVGNIPTLDQEQFGDFRSCLGIFNNSTKLQKNRKTKKTERKDLPGACNPAHLPAQPSAAPASCLPARQAGRCSTASTAWVPRTCSPPRRSTRPANAVDQPLSIPRTPQTSPLLSSSSPSRSPAMADATAAAPSP